MGVLDKLDGCVEKSFSLKAAEFMLTPYSKVWGGKNFSIIFSSVQNQLVFVEESSKSYSVQRVVWLILAIVNVPFALIAVAFKRSLPLPTFNVSTIGNVDCALPFLESIYEYVIAPLKKAESHMSVKGKMIRICLSLSEEAASLAEEDQIEEAKQSLCREMLDRIDEEGVNLPPIEEEMTIVKEKKVAIVSVNLEDALKETYNEDC